LLICDYKLFYQNVAYKWVCDHDLNPSKLRAENKKCTKNNGVLVLLWSSIADVHIEYPDPRNCYLDLMPCGLMAIKVYQYGIVISTTTYKLFKYFKVAEMTQICVPYGNNKL